MPAKCLVLSLIPTATQTSEVCALQKFIWYQTLHKLLTTSYTHHNFQDIKFLLHYASGVKPAAATTHLHPVAHKMLTTEPCETKVMYAGKLQSLSKTLLCHLRVNFQCIYVHWVHCDSSLIYTPLQEEVSNMSFRFCN